MTPRPDIPTLPLPGKRPKPDYGGGEAKLFGAAAGQIAIVNAQDRDEELPPRFDMK